MSKQRYEKEIEEILSKYDADSGRAEKKPEEKKLPRDFGVYSKRPAPRSQPSVPSVQNWKRFGAGQYIVAAFGVALLAILVRRVTPDFVPLVLVIVSALLFLAPIALYRSTGTTTGGWSAREEKRWRGQVIDFNTRRNVTDDPFANIKRWLKRR